MSTVLKVVSKNNLWDIHGLLLEVQGQHPKMVYEFGDDASKYARGFQPDVFAYEVNLSTRYLDWSSELKEELTNGLISKAEWHFKVRLPALSNCSLWKIGLALVRAIIQKTDGLFFTEEMDPDSDKGLSLSELAAWEKKFDCKKKMEQELAITMELVEQQNHEVTIFGTYFPFVFNKNIVKELKAKKKPAEAFEKRMLRLQNFAFNLDLYKKATPLEIVTQSGKKLRVVPCTNEPLCLVINTDIDFVLFKSEGDANEFYFVPSKRVREVMPAECFVDEYSFVVELFCFSIWESEILPKAKLLNEPIA